MKPYQSIRNSKMTKEIRKSKKLTITELAGITRRGKYTLDIMLELLIRLLPAPVNDVAKRCHGSMAAKTMIG
jgi:hypothetical protein